MTKLKFGAIIIDGRGSLGGYVLEKGLSGNYLRTNSISKKKTSENQHQARNRFAIISNAWTNLTPEQRRSWNNKISLFSMTNVFGDHKNPTGKNLHQALNQNLFLSDQPLLEFGPDPLPVQSPGIENMEINSFPISLKIQTKYNTTGEKLMCYASAAISPGITSVRNHLRFIGSLAGDQPNIFNFSAAYTNRLPALFDQEFIFVGIRTININGQASELQTIKIQVTANQNDTWIMAKLQAYTTAILKPTIIATGSINIVVMPDLQTFTETLLAPIVTVNGNINITVPAGLINFAQTIISPTISGTRSTIATASLLAYNETIFVPTVIIINTNVNVIANANLFTFTENIFETLVTTTRNNIVFPGILPYSQTIFSALATGKTNTIATPGLLNFILNLLPISQPTQTKINPIADISIGDWSIAPLWSKLLESNNDYIKSTNVNSSVCIIALETIYSPNWANLEIVIAKEMLSTTHPDFKVELMLNTNTVIASVSTSISSPNWTYLLLPLSSHNFDSSNNYSVVLTRSGSGSPSARKGIFVKSLVMIK